MEVFPAGSNTVTVKTNSEPPTSIPFTVPGRSVPLNLLDHSGLWWVPSEPGWALGVWHGPTNIVFASWFVYDASGNPTWYTLEAQATGNDASYYRGPVYKTRGPYFGGAFDPARVSYVTAGTGSLDFYNSNGLVFNYTVDGVTGIKYLSTQAIE